MKTFEARALDVLEIALELRASACASRRADIARKWVAKKWMPEDLKESRLVDVLYLSRSITIYPELTPSKVATLLGIKKSEARKLLNDAVKRLLLVRKRNGVYCDPSAVRR